jgi:hypothetical protein
MSNIKGGIELLGQIIKTGFNLLKNSLGMFLFLLLIVALYFHGENPDNKIYSDLSKEKIESYEPHFKCSMLVIDCEKELYTIKSLKDGEIYTHVQKMNKAVKVDLINKYSRIVLIRPKCDEFEVDTFNIGEIRFRDGDTYVDYKRGGKVFEYR